MAANGEQINTGALTAAHKSLPFGTLVRVTNKGNGRSAVVRINDRVPSSRAGLLISHLPLHARSAWMVLRKST